MRVKKRESLKKRLFYLVAASFAEMAEDIYDVFFNPYDFSGFSKYERHRAANIAHQLQRSGDIEKVVDEKGEVYFRFTDKGRTRLIKDVPLLRFQKKPWDGKWRQIVFDIPERMKVKRETFRNKLKSLGFGMLQRSVYITPFDISEEIADFLEENSLEEYAVVFEMERLTGESEKELANAVWGLDDLHRRYLDFVTRWGEFLKQPKAELLRKFEECQGEYFSILVDDPGLPRELLPDDWLSSRANEIFKTLLSYARQAKKRKLASSKKS
ncbi:MAG: PaaX family transcriptional regulator C-terminal domain-containing protein [Microgenomates group bacterium]